MALTAVATTLNNETYPPNIAKAMDTFTAAAVADISTLAGGAQAGVAPTHVVDLATTAALPAGTYSSTNKTFSVTATGTLTVDGQVTTLGQRILVANQATASQNGIYKVTTAGAGGGSPVAAVLTRDADALVTADFQPGMLVSTSGLGTTNPSSVYVFTSAAGFVLDTNNATYAKVATLNEFVKAVSVQAPQAQTSSAVAEFIMGMLSGSGNITAAYFCPMTTSTPATGSNSQALAITRYNASGSSQGAVAGASIANATPATALTRFTLGAITNGAWSDGDVLTAKTTLTGTATLPAGVWVVVGTPN